MRWIKGHGQANLHRTYEEFTSMSDMIADALEEEIRSQIDQKGWFSKQEFDDLVGSRRLDSGMADEVYQELLSRGVVFGDGKQIVVDDEFGGGHFSFTFEKVEKQGEETYYWGTLYCPDYEYGGDEDEQESHEGKLYGRIVAFENGMVMLDFECPDDLTVYDFCEGLEHELDNFASYAVDEINKRI